MLISGRSHIRQKRSDPQWGPGDPRFHHQWDSNNNNNGQVDNSQHVSADNLQQPSNDPLVMFDRHTETDTEDTFAPTYVRDSVDPPPDDNVHGDSQMSPQWRGDNGRNHEDRNFGDSDRGRGFDPWMSPNGHWPPPDNGPPGFDREDLHRASSGIHDNGKKLLTKLRFCNGSC